MSNSSWFVFDSCAANNTSTTLTTLGGIDKTKHMILNWVCLKGELMVKYHIRQHTTDFISTGALHKSNAPTGNH